MRKEEEKGRGRTLVNRERRILVVVKICVLAQSGVYHVLLSIARSDSANALQSVHVSRLVYTVGTTSFRRRSRIDSSIDSHAIVRLNNGTRQLHADFPELWRLNAFEGYELVSRIIIP